MCYHFKQTKTQGELEERFQAEFKPGVNYNPTVYNAFTHPHCAVITNNKPRELLLFSWGLIPHWAKDSSIAKYTLNARRETLHEKPSFKSSIKNRCIIPANGFYEWKHLDAKGNNKRKYELSINEGELFAFAGLWSENVNRETGEIQQTFTIITTAANELMSKIHNTKKRTPIILSPGTEQDWLQGGDYVLGNDYITAL